MATRERFAVGHLESQARREMREGLVDRLTVAHAIYRKRPYEHGAEISYHVALEELVRFEDGR